MLRSTLEAFQGMTIRETQKENWEKVDDGENQGA